MKINLHTKIQDLDRTQLRKLNQFMIAWCEHYFGARNVRGSPVRVRHVDPEDPDDWDNQYYGWYNRDTHCIYINVYRSKHIKQYMKTFLHEYTHSLQPVRTRYDNYSKVFGYADNPHEVHARANEMYYRYAWKTFKQLYPEL